jgi:hypothetical protein
MSDDRQGAMDAMDAMDATDAMDDESSDPEMLHINSLKVFHANKAKINVCYNPSMSLSNPLQPNIPDDNTIKSHITVDNRIRTLNILYHVFRNYTSSPITASRIFLNAYITTTPINIITNSKTTGDRLINDLYKSLICSGIITGRVLEDRDVTGVMTRPSVSGERVKGVVLPGKSMGLFKGRKGLEGYKFLESVKGGLEYDLGLYRLKYPVDVFWCAVDEIRGEGTEYAELFCDGKVSSANGFVVDASAIEDARRYLEGCNHTQLPTLTDAQTAKLTESFVGLRQDVNRKYDVGRKDLEGWCWMTRGEMLGGAWEEVGGVWEEGRVGGALA